MLPKQFNDFLVQQVATATTQGIAVGFRYQFKSPDIENSTGLYQVFMDQSNGCILDDNENKTEIPFLFINEIKLLVVLHNDETGIGYTQNYISRLRDLVSGQQGAFKNTALLIIHNSMLDTIINTCENLAQKGAVWHPVEIKARLSEYLSEDDNKFHILTSLLNSITEDLIKDTGTVFGLNDLYLAILDNEIDLPKLGYLSDIELMGWQDQVRIESRLSENKDVYDDLQYITEHQASELAEKLGELNLGEKFIADHFQAQSDFSQTIDYGALRAEQDKNKELALAYEGYDIPVGNLVIREKSQTKAGKKEKHLILELPPTHNQFEIVLSFSGDKVSDKLTNISPKSVDSVVIEKVNNLGKTKKVTVTGVISEQPCYFSVDVVGEKSNDKVKFKILVLPVNIIDITEIKANYLIYPNKQYILLQTDETTLKISPQDSVATLDKIGQGFDASEIGNIDFSGLIKIETDINFSVKNGLSDLNINIEGLVLADKVELPLLLNTDNFTQLFNDGYYAEYNRDKQTVLLLLQEYELKNQQLIPLMREASIVDHSLLHISEHESENIHLVNIQDSYPELFTAYQALYHYYSETNSLPSLVGWGDQYVALVNDIVSFYNAALNSISYSVPLTLDQKNLVKIGLATFNEEEFITPFHPLSLAYYANLVEEIKKDKAYESYATLPKVTLERLNPQGLIPFVYHPKHEFSYVQIGEDNCSWLKMVPKQNSNHSFVRRLVKDKVKAFKTIFSSLFSVGNKPTLLINSVDNNDNREIFMGLIDLFILYKDKSPYIHVNLYDDEHHISEFDLFSELSSLEELKETYGLNKGSVKDNADLLVDLLRTRLTYSKFKNSEINEQVYAHITFFKNKHEVKRRDVNPDCELSAVSCGGLISGEAVDNKNGTYFTGFGLRNIDVKGKTHLEIAQKYNRLLKPAYDDGENYDDNRSTSIMVSNSFRELLERSYESSIWTCVIDPKVTLSFFKNTKNMVLIHYSENYTNSSNYDAITVTKDTDMYRRVLEQDNGGSIEEFNAFNGEWLLEMVNDNANERKAKRGILGAYKYVNCLLINSDIVWVPLSIAEILRVAGNLGLKMSKSDFSRHCQGYKKGKISDDILFVGFKDDQLILMPVEVKTGKRQTHSKGVEQTQELKRYFEELLGQPSLAGGVYRGLFIRQILMQIDKYKLYDLYKTDYFNAVLERREWWLAGSYQLAQLVQYPQGLLVVNVEDESFKTAKFTPINNILKVEISSENLPYLITSPLQEMLEGASSETLFHIDACYILNGEALIEPVVGKTTITEIDDTISAKVETESVAITDKEPSANDDISSTAMRNNMSSAELNSIYDKVVSCLAEHNVYVTKPADQEAFVEGPASILLRVKPNPGTDPKRLSEKSQALKLDLCLEQEQNLGFAIDKGCVTIDIPKSQEQRYFVDQHDIWDNWEQPDDALEVPLGEDRFGEVVKINFSSSNCPHLLIGGTTGSGKSEALNTILYGMVEHYSADELKLMLVDPKGTELNGFERYSHLLGSIGWDDADALELLNTAVEEMQNRYAQFKAVGVRSLPDYNKQAADGETIPWWVIVLDEYADLTSDKEMKKQIEAELKRLAQKARAAGIHLIIATQKPSADVISTNLRSNLPAQLALRVKNGTESRVILDEQGAEVLNGKGDAYLKSEGKLVRIQCARVSI
ncbi:DNA phosphorothioation-dependent restriction protein DptH [Moritella sp. 36]|uniref:DNA phosphorothioation-dependent restriction protein DptH n=1 Tax=Moritella sp. 36 TaxID=2746233 RepID=UPI001BEF4E25|nr:DNA phosphorothioation-dependent restriction protein DptH [Moritella sp. 36]QUM89944.1 DNA phosphorothioation-dependent restriction protein DptH [Moritella sp. 36]